MAAAEDRENQAAALERRGVDGPSARRDDTRPAPDEKRDDEDKDREEADRGDDESDNKSKKSDKDDPKKKKDDKNKDDKSGKDSQQKKNRWPLIILAVLVLLAIIGGVVYWLMTRDEESTDDAYTEGNAVSITAKISGFVVERHVDDNSFVAAGELMLRIDPRDYITARDQARANLDLAKAQLVSAEVSLETTRIQAPASLQQAQAQLDQARANKANAESAARRQRDVDPRATTQSNVDQANAQFLSSAASVSSAEAQVQSASVVDQSVRSAESTVQQRQAQVEQAQANLDQAELNLSYTELRASQDGWVTRRNVDVGTYAQAGQQLFYLVAPNTWVVANFKETQLARMRPGQAVDIKVDAYPDLKLRGHVESIQQGSGARFSAFPAENATGNFVKIVRRVPVKIVVDEGADPKRGLPLGISVVPTVALK